jgi:hypothetical protein
VIRSLTGSFAPLPPGAKPTSVVVLAAPGDPDLVDYDSGSRAPTGHVTCCGAQATRRCPAGAHRSQPQGRPGRDHRPPVPDPIRRPAHPPALPRRRGGVWARRPDSTWYLIRADTPSRAFNHQRRLLAGEPGHAGEGDCQVCPAEILGNGGLPDMLRLAARLGADVTPRPGRPHASRCPACPRAAGLCRAAARTSHPTTRAWQGFSPTRLAPGPERLLWQFPLTFVSQTCWTGLDSGAPIGHVRGSDVQD